jgi:hypothetical protein
MDKYKDRMKDISDMEQARAFVVDNFPSLWYGLFEACKTEGFTEDQAMDILKIYISTTLSNRIGGEV